MSGDLWIEHPFVQKIGHKLLDLYERTTRRPTRLALNELHAPQLHRADADEGLLLEKLLSDFEKTGAVKVLQLKAPRGSPMLPLRDRNPRLELVDEERLRRLLERPVETKWQDEFMAHARHVFPESPELLEHLQNYPLRSLESLSPDVVCNGLLALRSWAKNLLLTRRQASGRAFAGLSKVLDSRDELLRVLTGQVEPFPETPVHLLARADEDFSSVLFVENQDTYTAMAKNPQLCAEIALVWAAGFRGSTERLRDQSGCVLYVAPMRADVDANIALRRMEAWRVGNLHLPTFFFGDLDFSGMSILKALRATFGDVRAWRPGYETLVLRLELDLGHEAEASGKERQVDPGTTGDEYADIRLLPAMRSRKRCFVDQEGWEGH